MVEIKHETQPSHSYQRDKLMHFQPLHLGKKLIPPHDSFLKFTLACQFLVTLHLKIILTKITWTFTYFTQLF